MKQTPEELRQKERELLIRELLGEKYLRLRISGDYIIKENLQTEKTDIICKVVIERKEKESSYNIEGSGCGPIDAFFSSLLLGLSKEYESLKTFQFSALGLNSKVITNESLNHSGSDAPVEAILAVVNERGDYLYFRNRSKSLSRAAIQAVLNAVEHFVNTEEAIGLLGGLLKDAKKRSRGDLVDTYTSMLVELVKVTDYSKER